MRYKQEGRSPETDQWSGTICKILVEHHEEQFCKIILNLGQWFRRRCRFKYFLSEALAVLPFGAADQFMQF